jgi:polyisoprenoid-binding protein YceI
MGFPRLSLALRVSILSVLVVAAWGAAHAPSQAQPLVATVDSTESVIDYTGSAPLHDWTGTSRSVSGRFVLDPTQADSNRAVVRASVASFDSGNDRRDRKMREVTEVAQYPQVEFRATNIEPLIWGRTADGRAGRWRATGTLTFHGRTHPVEAPVRIRAGTDSVYARAEFAISLTRFEVERPSLLWASIGDTIRIDARIRGAIAAPSSAERSRMGPAREHPSGPHVSKAEGRSPRRQ